MSTLVCRLFVLGCSTAACVSRAACVCVCARAPRAPDSAKPQVKMLVPSSFAGLKEVCQGSAANVQMNDLDDAQYESVCAKLGIKL